MTATAPSIRPVASPQLHDPAITVRGLRRRYRHERHTDPARTKRTGRSSGASFEAVRGIDLEVGRGELLALLGTNGAGKTSTLEVIEGLAPGSAGTVRVLGHDPYTERALVRPHIGILLQEGGFPGAVTVEEMASFWRRTLTQPRSVAEVLDMVVLSHRAGASIQSLSGGERRRLDLALALLSRPEVLFLDEPTTGLDPQSRRATWDLVRTLLDEDTTVLLTTHYLEEAEELADRIAIMHEGRIATTGSLHEIVSRQPTRISLSVDDTDPLVDLRETFGAGLTTESRAGRLEVQIETFDPRSALSALLSWDTGRSSLIDLKVLPGSLEQAFMDVARSSTDATWADATPANASPTTDPALEGAHA